LEGFFRVRPRKFGRHAKAVVALKAPIGNDGMQVRIEIYGHGMGKIASNNLVSALTELGQQPAIK
jgi:hypothetical protein